MTEKSEILHMITELENTDSDERLNQEIKHFADSLYIRHIKEKIKLNQSLIWKAWKLWKQERYICLKNFASQSEEHS